MVSCHSQVKKYLKNTVVQRENAYLCFASDFFVSENYFIPVIYVLGMPLFLHRKMDFQHSAGALIGPIVTSKNSHLKTDSYLHICIKDGFCNSRISSNIRGLRY